MTQNPYKLLLGMKQTAHNVEEYHKQLELYVGPAWYGS